MPAKAAGDFAGDFFDTNVLVYLASAEPAKAERAERLLERGGVISVQVLNELANVARRKMNLSWLEAEGFLQTLCDLLTVHPVTLDTHKAGMALAARYNFAVFDAMIVASALQAECATLWSEDMQHGMLIDERLRILNPFR